ncbi:RES domain-containing protein [Mesorhizobium sp. BR1-1-13]|uniref:RES family NAD+ phosphorylase n=1 Tax=Mesorhizobium sp. BR1-1-13 TaxID=2876656 RepID=UPI001CD0B1FF|nr:RES domain-containing protein [Mesorhizobium sp. BR1-1-13]MBZ9942130.1 RES domain-containing protein [Mesorhizobium sp. BR1-1-13]
MRYRGPLYRALNPIYASEPLAGRGAELYGGRFNAKGVPALSSSLTVLTALREANQAGSFQPTTLVSYDADVDNIFDTRDEAALNAEELDSSALADPAWRDQMKIAGEAKTQAFARHLIAKGYRALLVRSFAPGATRNDLNLVLWQWSDAAPSRLTLIDDENRLSRSPVRVAGTGAGQDHKTDTSRQSWLQKDNT